MAEAEYFFCEWEWVDQASDIKPTRDVFANTLVSDEAEVEINERHRSRNA